MGELKHFFHEHKLILNEVEPVVGKDVECAMCRQSINKLIDAFYRCNTSLIDGSSSSVCVGFFVHKTCSELPPTFTHPTIPQHPLSLFASHTKNRCYSCNLCEADFQGFQYASHNGDFFVCLKCVTSEVRSLEDSIRCHPGHNHPLTVVQSPALFLCHACNTTSTDLSYICHKCCFWIHKSCANAPITYQSKFHKEHALILDYSLPQVYREFRCFCSICSKLINYTYWVYHCANCRFFAHVKCASSTEMLSESDDDEVDSGESNLMHFPAHDEASLHEMMQQCIMKATLLHNSATIAEPSPCIKHWAHKHQLALGNKNTKTCTPYLNRKLEDTEVLICDGCTKPISLVDEIFYECNACNFFLHRSCALFPEKMEHHLAGKLDERVLAREVHELDLKVCQSCNMFGNGIFLWNETACFDIGCVSLPKKIKHEAHRHSLNQLKYPGDDDYYYCKACSNDFEKEKDCIMYGCEKCEFYIHIRCAVRLTHLVKHRWDSHPLYLILFSKNVADHPHDYDCEFCSEQIYPGGWFYHCITCDLSFHNHCIDPYDWLSNLKLGATNIYSDAHPHGLALILNKKKISCKICDGDVMGRPVLECSPCKYKVHPHCLFEELI